MFADAQADGTPVFMAAIQQQSSNLDKQMQKGALPLLVMYYTCIIHHQECLAGHRLFVNSLSHDCRPSKHEDFYLNVK